MSGYKTLFEYCICLMSMLIVEAFCNFRYFLCFVLEFSESIQQIEVAGIFNIHCDLRDVTLNRLVTTIHRTKLRQTESKSIARTRLCASSQEAIPSPFLPGIWHSTSQSQHKDLYRTRRVLSVTILSRPNSVFVTLNLADKLKITFCIFIRYSYSWIHI